jgi:hypothetical protein
MFFHEWASCQHLAQPRLLARYAEEVAALEEDLTSELDQTDVETFRFYIDATSRGRH